MYGHPKGHPLDCLREVPWIEAAATDRGTHDPDLDAEADTEDVSQRLRDLGYLG